MVSLQDYQHDYNFLKFFFSALVQQISQKSTKYKYEKLQFLKLSLQAKNDFTNDSIPTLKCPNSAMKSICLQKPVFGSIPGFCFYGKIASIFLNIIMA